MFGNFSEVNDILCMECGVLLKGKNIIIKVVNILLKLFDSILSISLLHDRESSVILGLLVSKSLCGSLGGSKFLT
jgi:hypothetical protein